MKKRALILGITGQDGSYMLELLIKKKYEVHGLIRKSATGNTKHIDHLINNKKIFNKSFFLHRGDLLDVGSIYTAIEKANPNEIYNVVDKLLSDKQTLEKQVTRSNEIIKNFKTEKSATIASEVLLNNL